jgi:hypothetical protein
MKKVFALFAISGMLFAASCGNKSEDTTEEVEIIIEETEEAIEDAVEAIEEVVEEEIEG